MMMEWPECSAGLLTGCNAGVLARVCSGEIIQSNSLSNRMRQGTTKVLHCRLFAIFKEFCKRLHCLVVSIVTFAKRPISCFFFGCRKLPSPGAQSSWMEKMLNRKENAGCTQTPTKRRQILLPERHSPHMR